MNPLDVRAQERLATITLDLALARPERTPEAVEAARAWASLMPGYWQATFDLGAALVRLDMPELAIAPLQQESGLTASVRVNTTHSGSWRTHTSRCVGERRPQRPRLRPIGWPADS